MIQAITVFVHSLSSYVLCVYCVPGSITSRLWGHGSWKPSGPSPRAAQETQESVRGLLLCGLPQPSGSERARASSQDPRGLPRPGRGWGCSPAGRGVALTGILTPPPRFPASTVSPMLQPPQVTPGSSKSGST